MQQTNISTSLRSQILQCYLLDDSRVLVTIKGESLQLPKELLNIIQENKGSLFGNYFEIPRSLYRQFVQKTMNLLRNISIEKIPDEYLNLELDIPVNHQINPIKGNEIEMKLIEKGRQLNGRILICENNKRNLRKNACFLAKYLKKTKPLLIICPKGEQKSWKDFVMDYFKLQEDKILVVTKELPKNDSSDVIIISFEYNQNLGLEAIELCIVDEQSHLMDIQDKECKFWIPILQKSKNIIMLQLDDQIILPCQLFPTLNIIRPDIFSFSLLQSRYCKLNKEALKELHYLINKYILFWIDADVNSKKIQRIKFNINCVQSVLEKLNNDLKNKTPEQVVQNIMKVQEHKIGLFQYEEFNKFQSQTSEGKKSDIKKYIEDLFSSVQLRRQKPKIIIFALKNNILDQLSSELNGYKLVKLYGEGNAKKQLVQEFNSVNFIGLGLTNQHIDSWCEAKLSVTDIVFAELPIKHTTVLKFEKLLVPNQENQNICCHFLIGQNTFDELIMREIEEKYENIQWIFRGQGKSFILPNNGIQEKPLQMLLEPEIKLTTEVISKREKQQINIDQNQNARNQTQKITLTLKCQKQTNEVSHSTEQGAQKNFAELKNQKKVFKLVRLVEANSLNNIEGQIDEKKIKEEQFSSNLQTISQLITQMEQNTDDKKNKQNQIQLNKMFQDELQKLHSLFSNLQQGQEKSKLDNKQFQNDLVIQQNCLKLQK